MAEAVLWRNRDYMLLWGGQVVSTLGSMAAHVIYPLLILAMTDSPTAAGIAAALRFLPYLVFSLPVGALIDRWDRKRVMILADLGRAAAVASIPLAMAFDALSLALIYAVSLIEGTLFVFFNIAQVAALPRVVPREQLPQATAQNEASYGVATVVGPSLGTFLYQTFGRAMPFVLDAVSYLLSLACLVAMKTEFRRQAPASRPDLRAEIADGLRWLWGQPLIRYMAFLTGGINLVNAAIPLMLVVLAKELGASDAQVGVIFSIAGAGAIAGSLVGGQIQRRFSFGQVIVGTLWMEAALFVLFVAVPGYVWVGVLAAMIFVLGPVYNVVQFSYRIALIPDELQGRVNSTFRLVAFAFMPPGAALCGWLLERFGTGATVGVFGGWLFLLAAATTMNPHVRTAAPLAKAIPAT